MDFTGRPHLDAETGGVPGAEAVGVLNQLQGDAAVLERRQVPLHTLQQHLLHAAACRFGHARFDSQTDHAEAGRSSFCEASACWKRHSKNL